ncbi:aminopeptidase [Escherichia coli]|nr:aminopeptidase [Escherichia coli]
MKKIIFAFIILLCFYSYDYFLPTLGQCITVKRPHYKS